MMMISCIRTNMARAALVAMLLLTFSASGATVPRAWLISKGDAQAVLVGESHIGTPVENDRYFDTVIKPSYAVADVAIMETYFGPEQTRNESFERGAPCFNSPRGLHTPRLRLAFDALISATRDNGLKVPIWLEDWELVPEFQFTSLYFDSFTSNSMGPAYDAAIRAQGGVGTSFRLRGQIMPTKQIIGLDTMKDLRTEFCSASATDRADFLADLALQVAHLLRLKQSDPSYASIGQLATLVGESLAEAVRCVDQASPCAVDQVSPSVRLLQEKGWIFGYSQGTLEISLKKRTRAWLPLIVKTISTHRRSFVIVGSLHLPDLRVGNQVEPGLISLLRQQGFSVTRIDGARDIQTSFLSPSWFDRIRSALTSIL